MKAIKLQANKVISEFHKLPEYQRYKELAIIIQNKYSNLFMKLNNLKSQYEAKSKTDPVTKKAYLIFKNEVYLIPEIFEFKQIEAQIEFKLQEINQTINDFVKNLIVGGAYEKKLC